MLASLARLIRSFGDRSGQIAVWLAIAAVPMTMSMGLGIDFARTTAARARLQAALDAAVVAGARDASANWTTVAKGVFDGHAMSADLTVTSVAFSLDASGHYVGNAAGTLPTTLMTLANVQTMDLAATSTATASTAGTPVCILLLSTTASPGLLMNGGADITAPDCEVHVKSTANPAATFNANTTLDTKKTCLAGSSTLDNGGFHPNVTKSCKTADDPFAGKLPTPASSTCTYSNMNISGGTTTLYPGVYCGWFNLNSAPTINFQPGVYVIKGGGVNVNGGIWKGTGVTFYFADTSYIQFNGTVTLDLAAPTSGTYAGILMYEAAGLAKSAFSINATNGATLKGLVYLPSRAVTLNSGASAIAETLTLVLDSLIVNTVEWTLATSDKAVMATAGGSASIYLRR